jgi:hypothetical protein
MHTQQKILSPDLNKELIRFFVVHPARRVSRNLRRVLLDYLRDQLETGVPLFIDELLWDMYDLFDVLDVATTETRGGTTSETMIKKTCTKPQQHQPLQ